MRSTHASVSRTYPRARSGSARSSAEATPCERALLQVDDLHVWFDLPDGGELHAVQGVGFTLERGDRLGLVGESGCGKTTTALAVLGLLPANASAAGRVLLEGKDVLGGGEASLRPHRWTDIAIVFQGAMNALNPVRTVGSADRRGARAP